MESELIGKLAATGLMGVVAGLFVYIAFDRDKKLFASLAARIADNDAIKTVVNVVTTTLNSVKISIDNRAEMTAKMEETLRSVATAQSQQALVLEGLRQSLDNGDRDFAIHVEKFSRLTEDIKVSYSRIEDTLRRIENLARRNKAAGDEE